MSGQQPPQGPNTFQALRQAMGNAAAGKTEQRIARLSKEPVRPEMELSTQQRTFVDPQTGEIKTVQEGRLYVLSCGCLVSGPQEIAGVCPGCASLSRWGRLKRPRYLCANHSLCLRCRQRRLREARGGGLVRRLIKGLFKLILWPAFDVED